MAALQLGEPLPSLSPYSVNVALYETPPDDGDEVEDAGVLGAGLPTEAVGDEETTLAGAFLWGWRGVAATVPAKRRAVKWAKCIVVELKR